MGDGNAEGIAGARFTVLHGVGHELPPPELPLLAAEMSDGTLRFLCLAVALLSPRPPVFLAINEPENSLHRDMLPALARLIIEASRYSQIWLTSHSAELAELIAAGAPCQRYALENRGGETRIVE